MSQQHKEAAGKDAHEAALHCCRPAEQQNQREHKCSYNTAELWVYISVVYLRAGMDVAMGEQVFVESR